METLTKYSLLRIIKSIPIPVIIKNNFCISPSILFKHCGYKWINDDKSNGSIFALHIPRQVSQLGNNWNVKSLVPPPDIQFNNIPGSFPTYFTFFSCSRTELCSVPIAHLDMRRWWRLVKFQLMNELSCGQPPFVIKLTTLKKQQMIIAMQAAIKTE